LPFASEPVLTLIAGLRSRKENSCMTIDQPSAAARPGDVSDPVREADLERVLKTVPSGALALCAIAVTLLLAAWLFVYFGVFIPRGPVG